MSPAQLLRKQHILENNLQFTFGEGIQNSAGVIIKPLLPLIGKMGSQHNEGGKNSKALTILVQLGKAFCRTSENLSVAMGNHQWGTVRI